MKLCLLFLVFAGVVLIMANQLVACGQRQRPVEYRYLPRDLDTYLRTQPFASAELRDMFEGANVRWWTKPPVLPVPSPKTKTKTPA